MTVSDGGVGVTSEDMMDELELDEEDDGVPEDDEDDEYNEITEAPRSGRCRTIKQSLLIFKYFICCFCNIIESKKSSYEAGRYLL